LGAKTEENRGSYVPVMGHYRLLPLYDLLQGLLGVAPAHQTIIDQADMRPGQGVLEIGCGTGYLAQPEPCAR
jgi:ubiquinone/menaquinone biosynthesis C-methylase UbiE